MRPHPELVLLVFEGERSAVRIRSVSGCAQNQKRGTDMKASGGKPLKRGHALSFAAVIAALIFFVSCSKPVLLSDYRKAATKKKYDLVLIHGLSNLHHWSDDFLRVCLYHFGSGRVYVIYTNESTKIWSRSIDGMTVHLCGNDRNFSGGKDTIERQAELVKIKIDLLQRKGLGRSFNLIAHSMGGLTSRKYIYDNPGRVTALVTLGTPHHGSPLADSFKWVGLFIGAKKAILDLQPKRCEAFNEKYPIDESLMADGGRVFTIDGRTSRGKSFGVIGELSLGWEVLKTVYKLENDGMVPEGSGKIAGAKHVAHFDAFDHLQLVTEPAVAAAACECLR